MDEIIEMPYWKKFDIVERNIYFYWRVAPEFIRQHLDEDAMVDLRRLWRAGTKWIPEIASHEEKYERAYKNWIWMAKSTLDFIQERLGESGVKLFERAEADALEKWNRDLATLMLNMIRSISPGAAFEMFAKEMAFYLQWLTPFTVTELSREQFIGDITRCKILDYPGTQSVCRIGCQAVTPLWMAEQYKVRMCFARKDHHCIWTITPLN